MAHFPWVHDGTLGDRDLPVPPVPELRREQGELRFEFAPPEVEVVGEGFALAAEVLALAPGGRAVGNGVFGPGAGEVAGAVACSGVADAVSAPRFAARRALYRCQA